MFAKDFERAPTNRKQQKLISMYLVAYFYTSAYSYRGVSEFSCLNTDTLVGQTLRGWLA